MRQVRQAVDDGNGGIARQFLNLGVIIRADHDCVDIAGKDSRRVRYRLSAPKLHGTAVHDDACAAKLTDCRANRSEEHTSELQSLMRTSYAVFCLKQKKNNKSSHTSYKNTTYHPDAYR